MKYQFRKSAPQSSTQMPLSTQTPPLSAGVGVCGAIFHEAGYDELTAVCNAIGGCKTGNAVITPGFNLPAENIIHAAGPVYQDGKHHEPQLLYSAYKQSLILAKENACHSIGFPLISAGIFGYPKDNAWRKALQTRQDFIDSNPEYVTSTLSLPCWITKSWHLEKNVG